MVDDLVVRDVALQVLAQEETGPVDRAGEDPRRLRARPFGGFDLDRAPLLPDHRASERGDQRDDDHRRQQRGATFAAASVGSGRTAHGAIKVSRTRLPARPLPGAKPRTTRTPSGNAIFGAPPDSGADAGAVGSWTTSPVDWQFAHALPRKK